VRLAALAARPRLGASGWLTDAILRSHSGFLPEALLGFLNPNLPHHLELYRPKPWGLIIVTPIACVAYGCVTRTRCMC
jgi:hypothetical protein